MKALNILLIASEGVRKQRPVATIVIASSDFANFFSNYFNIRVISPQSQLLEKYPVNCKRTAGDFALVGTFLKRVKSAHFFFKRWRFNSLLKEFDKQASPNKSEDEQGFL